MMNAFLRNKRRFPQRVRSAKRRRSASRNYRGEQLEARALLAGDIFNAYHNADMPADVSGDGRVALNDALLLVSELRHTGPRQLGIPLGSGGEGEGEGAGQPGGGIFLDVNGDEKLTLTDALDVVSELRSEGEGQANNDNINVEENVNGSNINVQLDLLQNDDSDPGDTLAIEEIQFNFGGTQVNESDTDTVVTTESGGEFRIASDRGSVFYTPRPGFFGEERFTYVLSDNTSGVTTSAQVTVDVAPVNPAVQFRLEASATEKGAPLSDIDVGDEFVLNVYVQDIRSDLNDSSIQGLEQAFLDVVYDTGLVTLLDNSQDDITFGEEFDFESFQFADLSTPGEIGEAGSGRNNFVDPPPPPLGNGEFLLFAAHFRADVSGTANFSGNHPEDPSFSQTLVTNPPGGVEIFTPEVTPADEFFVLQFIDENLTINASGFAMSDSATVMEDSNGSAAANQIQVLDNDTTPVGGTLEIDDVSVPANGTATVDNNGTPLDTTDDFIVYVPNANFAGTDSFTYIASDGLGNTDNATVSITVTEVNDDPTANDDNFNVAFNSSEQTLNVLANDSTDPDSDTLESLTVASVDDTGTSGTVSVNSDGSGVLYTPPAGMFATDTFTYTISDGRNGTDTATVTINGVPFDNVVAFRIEPSQSTVDVGDTVTLNVFLEDLREDPSIDLGVFEAYIDLAYDTSLFQPATTDPNQVVDFDIGPYEAFDDNDPTIDTVNGVIRNIGGFHPDGISNPPVIPNGGEELPFFSIDFNAIGSGTADFTSGPDSDPLFFGINLLDDAGSSTPVPPDDVDFGTTQVTVNPPVFDSDVVVFADTIDLNDVADPSDDVRASILNVGDTFQLQVSILDNRDTPPPEMIQGVFTAYIDLLIDQLGSNVSLVPGSFENYDPYNTLPLEGTEGPGRIDDVGDALSIDTATNPTFDGTQKFLVFSLDFMATAPGEAVFQTADSGNPDNTIEFIFPGGKVPVEDITFQAATVSIIDDSAPTARSDQFTAFENSTLNVAAPGVLVNDTDPNGDDLTASIVAQPTNGMVSLNADGSFSYTPDLDFTGTDTFSYRATDTDNNISNTAFVQLNVMEVPDIEVNNDVYTTEINQDLNVVTANGVLANDLGMGLTASLNSNVSNGTLSFNADGSFDYTPDTNFSGIDSFTYLATDSQGGSQEGTVVIGVGITPGSLSGRVYLDTNINGLYEPELGELAVGNAEVTITGSTGSASFFEQTVTTNAAGQYSITALLPGDYTIVEEIPEFLLSGTYTVNGNVTTNTAADLEAFVAMDTITNGESTVVNFGHMGIHPQFLTYRDVSARTPDTGLVIANDTNGDNLWYIVLEGWDGISDPTIEIAEDRLSADLSVVDGTSVDEFTIPDTGPVNFRTMGNQPGVGSLIRVEGSLDEIVAAGAGEFDPDALDTIMAEGFE